MIAYQERNSRMTATTENDVHCRTTGQVCDIKFAFYIKFTSQFNDLLRIKVDKLNKLW